MFERFTDRARKAVVLAQSEARELGHERVGTEHLLLGLASEECGGVATKALAALGADQDSVREAALKGWPRGSMRRDGYLPFTALAKKACENALREAVVLGHNYVGTEHMLLGLLRDGESGAAQALGELGLNLADVRAKVMELLGTYEGAGRIRPGPQPAATLIPHREPPASEVLAAARAVAERLADLDAWIERRAAQIVAAADSELFGRIAILEDRLENARAELSALREERDRLQREAFREAGSV